jgi:hypothetical protein
MRTSVKRFVVCLKNTSYKVSLEPRKIYQVILDSDAAKHRQLRVIDESGEDYLYPASYFSPIELPQPVRKAVLASNRPVKAKVVSARLATRGERKIYEEG